ncbi:HD domain-containing protein [Limosilactobacillus gastricus]|uniref:Hydrolase n=1 Tax=Limosilactobacillus gastricus DSM 16045 TaxID=1423749 RepID=A0A0R1V7R4_9LACO|nr:HD domain-containing protein [Limosilactobacillus gastricus]KRM01488.1 Hydrolase [Limosilactobacillus gastricus DSM 16045]QGF41029.1 HD domain-containing protein [Limosilactobacillus gastricus]
MLNNHQLDAIKAYAKEALNDDQTGHAMDHVMRVVNLATRLAEAEQVDATIPVMAAYLHDTIDPKLVADQDQAVAQLRTFLQTNQITSSDIDAVMDIITQMSFAKTLNGERPSLSKAGQIVQDADWLDAIGAIGIVRAIYYGARHQEKIYDSSIPPREYLDEQSYRNLADETIINHFYEKLLKIKDMLNTPAARQIAADRQIVMLNFLDDFKDEWDGLQ